MQQQQQAPQAQQQQAHQGGEQQSVILTDRRTNLTIKLPPSAKFNKKAGTWTETDPHRLAQRRKQTSFGKVTLGYRNYTNTVPYAERQEGNENHPSTPRLDQVCSKRSWDAQIGQWRRWLHSWDNGPAPETMRKSEAELEEHVARRMRERPYERNHFRLEGVDETDPRLVWAAALPVRWGEDGQPVDGTTQHAADSADGGAAAASSSVVLTHEGRPSTLNPHVLPFMGGGGAAAAAPAPASAEPEGIPSAVVAQPTAAAAAQQQQQQSAAAAAEPAQPAAGSAARMAGMVEIGRADRGRAGHEASAPLSIKVVVGSDVQGRCRLVVSPQNIPFSPFKQLLQEKLRRRVGTVAYKDAEGDTVAADDDASLKAFLDGAGHAHPAKLFVDVATDKTVLDLAPGVRHAYMALADSGALTDSQCALLLNELALSEQKTAEQARRTGAAAAAAAAAQPAPAAAAAPLQQNAGHERSSALLKTPQGEHGGKSPLMPALLSPPASTGGNGGAVGGGGEDQFLLNFNAAMDWKTRAKASSSPSPAKTPLRDHQVWVRLGWMR